MRTHTCLSTLNAQTHTHADCKQTHTCSVARMTTSFIYRNTTRSADRRREQKRKNVNVFIHIYINRWNCFWSLFYFRWLWSSLVVHVHESKDAQKCFLRLIRREAAVSVRFCDLWFQISSFMSLQLGANRSVWFKYNNHVVRVCKKIIFSLK